MKSINLKHGMVEEAAAITVEDISTMINTMINTMTIIMTTTTIMTTITIISIFMIEDGAEEEEEVGTIGMIGVVIMDIETIMIAITLHHTPILPLLM
jgi:hypothetical protein